MAYFVLVPDLIWFQEDLMKMVYEGYHEENGTDLGRIFALTITVSHLERQLPEGIDGWLDGLRRHD